VSELVPQDVLDLIKEEPYLSTACGTGIRIEAGPYEGHRHRGLELPEGVTPVLLEAEIRRLHARCRLTHKFTGTGCVCSCHGERIGVMADCQTCRGRRVVPDWKNWNHAHGEPRPKPCPDCQERSLQ